MDYELAKGLKEAGFPYGWCKDFGKEAPEGCSLACEQMGCFPTLSELIEACGEGFAHLQRSGNWYGWGGKCTNADSNLFEFHCYGATPEEAVARLWLALNNKHHAQTT